MKLYYILYLLLILYSGYQLKQYSCQLFENDRIRLVFEYLEIRIQQQVLYFFSDMTSIGEVLSFNLSSSTTETPQNETDSSFSAEEVIDDETTSGNEAESYTEEAKTSTTTESFVSSDTTSTGEIDQLPEVESVMEEINNTQDFNDFESDYTGKIHKNF